MLENEIRSLFEIHKTSEAYSILTIIDVSTIYHHIELYRIKKF